MGRKFDKPTQNWGSYSIKAAAKNPTQNWTTKRIWQPDDNALKQFNDKTGLASKLVGGGVKYRVDPSIATREANKARADRRAADKARAASIPGKTPIIHPPPPNARFVAGADGVFDRHRPYSNKTYGSIMREEAIAYNYSKSAGKTAYHRPIGPLPATGYKPKPGLNWWGRNAGKVKVGAGILGAAVGATLLVVGAGAYAGGTYLASNMSSHPTNRERYLGSQGAY